MIEKRMSDGPWNARRIARNMSAWKRTAACVVATAVAAAMLSSAAAQTPLSTDSLECSNLALAESTIAEGNSAVERGDSPKINAADNASCWIDLAELSEPGAPQPAWIDVRAAADSRAAPIPGALAIPLVELRSKSFLQSSPIVLIGSGRDDADLAHACGELRRAEFQQVKLLRGGIRAWVSARRPVMADGGVMQNLDLIAAGDLHRQASAAPWLMLGIDLPLSDALPAAMASLQQVDARNSPARALDAVRRRQAELAHLEKSAQPNAIVLVARDDASATKLRDAVRGAGLEDVLVLQGGMAGYRAFLSQQQSIAAAAGRPLVRSCGSG
jgi:rhodanese-related sulfurtransferase